MARRKSLASQLLDVVTQKQREAAGRAEEARRASERAAVEARTARERSWRQEEARRKAEAAEAARFERDRMRAKDKAVQRAIVELERTEREKAKAAQKAERDHAAAVRTAKQARVVDQRAEAEAMAAAAQGQLDVLSQVLANRELRMVAVTGMALETFTASGSGEFEHLLQRAFDQSRAESPLAGVVTEIQLQEQIKELIVDVELPAREVVPESLEFKYVVAKDTIVASKRKSADVRRDYADLAARVVLRTIREALDIAPTALVDTVVVNGHLSAVDAANGRPIRPCVLSVSAERAKVDALVLDQLDPATCLRTELKAIVSPNPYDLEPVRPVMAFDLSRYRFSEHQDIITGLDSRLDLLSLSPVEFEHLVRQLVEAMGMDAWNTQLSNDDGVDAVAVNPTPLIGGLCIIQAKRYRKVVNPEAVHALAGNVGVHKASRGILITTSWVSSKTRRFAEEHGRIDIYDGRELKALLQQHLNMDALISLPVVPRGWTEADVA